MNTGADPRDFSPEGGGGGGSAGIMYQYEQMKHTILSIPEQTSGTLEIFFKGQFIRNTFANL